MRPQSRRKEPRARIGLDVSSRVSEVTSAAYARSVYLSERDGRRCPDLCHVEVRDQILGALAGVVCLVRRHLPVELLELRLPPCCPAASPSQVAALGRTGRRAGRTASRPRCRPWPPGRRLSALSARCSGCCYRPLVRKLAGSSGSSGVAR